MATEEWVRSLNDPTLQHALDRAIRERGDAQAALNRWTRETEVLLDEYRRRRENEEDAMAGAITPGGDA